MRILGINGVPYGSTMRIMLGIAETAEKNDLNVLMASGYSYHPIADISAGNYVRIGGACSKLFHMVCAQLTGLNGCYSILSTVLFIGKVKKFKPDIINLHNIHGWYINLPMLFNYLKKYEIPVIWTLHDCWAFTGHCSHFDMIGCEKWKRQCYDCPLYREYPQSIFDNSMKMYNLKKKWFTGIRNLTIVTPSVWLKGVVQESFLKEYPIKVIHNGIDLSVFRPIQSSFRLKYQCEGKHLLLGVSFGWNERKGLDVFIELAKRLPGKYQIVLVGTDAVTDRQLPSNIISIHRTQNQRELAEIYTAADLFINPTREENYPTVNMEALACGTPVLTFNTGGSPEIPDETCGSVVPKNDIDVMEKEIIRICETKPYTGEACLERAKSFDSNERFQEYINLYRSMV